MKTRLAVVSLGCEKNLVDTENMVGMLKGGDFEIIPDPAEAELILINTCSFIKAAKEEAIDCIIELAGYKETGMCRGLIVAGCLAQRYGLELVSEMPEIDALIGTGSFHRIGKVCSDLMNHRVEMRGQKKLIYLEDPDKLFPPYSSRITSGPSHRAYVKIAEGCDNRCSYCLIPALRGSLKSRPLEEIVEEVRQLSRLGVKEINLIAQNVNQYGFDNPSGPRLVDLLRELVPVDGIKWIRLLYLYPADISMELLQFIDGEVKICRYLDIPFQHCCDSILKAMNRRGGRLFLEEMIARIREIVPGISLRSTFIVGFPGETEEEFEDLLSFVSKARFDHLGAFKYSREEGTPAAELPGQISEKVKTQRLKRLMKLQREISSSINAAKIGSDEIVMIDGFSEDVSYLLVGRTQGQAPEVDGLVYLDEGEHQPGLLAKVQITHALDYDLVGKVIQEESRTNDSCLSRGTT